MKKVKLITLLCITLFALAACSKNQDVTNQNPTKAPTTEPTKEATPIPTIEPTTAPVDTSNAQDIINEILTAVKEAYGERYLPMMQYDEIAMTEYFGVSPELYDAYMAEGPLITAQIDTFVAIHATEGNVGAVEEALNAYRDSQINDAFQYPSNMLKIQASKVIAVDDYVFFITLGTVNFNELEDETQYIEAFEAQNQIAVDAIYSVLS